MGKRKASHRPALSDEQQPPCGEGGAVGARAGACGGGEERERREGRVADVPELATSLLYVIIALWQAAITRKERSPRRVRAKPSGWWRFKLPDPSPPAAKMRRLAKREGKCMDCGATQTPQWRAGPDGLRTLCNSCGVRRRAVGERYGELRGPRRPKATADLDPDYELPSAPAAPPTMTMQAAPPTVESAPASTVDQERKTTTKKKNKPAKHSKKKQCDHCASSSTPKWREGPNGRRTLCNACGVRYKEGRLLPEYRPQASPSFDESMHASSHSQVLELRRQRESRRQQEPVDPSQDVHLMPPPPPLPLPSSVHHIASKLHVSAAIDDNSANAGVADVPMDDEVYVPLVGAGPIPPRRSGGCAKNGS